MNGLDADLQAKLDSRYRRTLVVYVGQIASAAVLAAAGWFFVPAVAPAADLTSIMPLWVLVLFLAVAAIVARRILSKWERLRDIQLLGGIDGLLKALHTNTIIVSVLAELIVVGGLVSACLTGQVGDLVRSVVIALIVFGLNFPRRLTWEWIVADLKDL